MKIEYLRKIIARIQNQIHCPKCKAPFAEDSIEILGVKGPLVEFSAECEQCKARSQISAEIGGSNLKPGGLGVAQYKRKLSGFELPAATLDGGQVQNLKQTLKGFKGTDIKTLFE